MKAASISRHLREHRRWGVRAVALAVIGAIWGLGLSRWVAEFGLWLPLYGSLELVVVVTAVCVAVIGLFFVFVVGRWEPALPLTFPLLYVTGVVRRPLGGGVLLIGGAVLALLIVWRDRARCFVPIVLVGSVLGLYLCTLLPSIGQSDTFEFQVVVPQLGVAHPTGYPLYVLLAKLFTLLPLGNMAWRVNLASAVFATGAVLVLYVLLTNLTTSWRRGARWLPAFVGALAFAFSSTFWSQAVIAEVYTLHNLLLSVILWLLLSVCPPASDVMPSLSPAHRWQAVFFLVGLSLTNHLTTALLLPTVALALLWDRPRLQVREWMVAGSLLLLGLSVYLFIPLRWPALHQGAWMTFREFVSYVTGKQFSGALRLSGWRDLTRWSIVWRLLRESFGWGGLGLAAVGAVGLAVRRRRTLALTGGTFLAFILYGLDYYVPDISVFILPAHLILAIWIGVGVAFLAALLSQFQKGAQVTGIRSFEVARWFLVVLAALLPLSRIWTNFSAVDRSHDRGRRAWGKYVLSLPLATDSAILADIDKFAPLYYLQQIEGERPDLDLMLFGSEELYYADLATRLDTGQTVYLARYLPELDGLHLRSVGPLVEVSKEVRPVADGAGVDFGGMVRLLDAEVTPDPLGRRLYHLTLYWQARALVDGDFVVRLRLVDAGGDVCWESGGVRPVGGLYPTNAWPVDVAISDYHEVEPPPWLFPGDYGLEVGLFPRFGDTGLQVEGGTTAWLPVGVLRISQPSALPLLPHQRRYAFSVGECLKWLTGYDLANKVPAAAPFTVVLSWRDVEEDCQVNLIWLDEQRREMASSTFPLEAGAVRSRHVVTAPWVSGDYTLRVGVVDEAARCGWLAPSSTDCPLSAVEVVAAQAGLANFADSILLLEAEAERSDARPGDVIPVLLRWQALRAMDENYTVFVHLVGPDGRLYGQVDMWPVQGSHPTSQWMIGEVVSDPYDVRLDPDAPPGDYRVEVGWYLLATMQRLSILDVEGRPIRDAFVVGAFEVNE